MPLIAQSEAEFAASMQEARKASTERRRALKRGPKKRYHLTILNGGPMDMPPVQHFTAGKLVWMARTLTYDPRTKETHSYPGAVVECTEAEFEDGIQRLSRYVVRWEGGGRRAKPYIPGVGLHEHIDADEDEEPLSNYLVARELGESADLVHGEVVNVHAEPEAPRSARDARTQRRHGRAKKRGGKPEPDAS